MTSPRHLLSWKAYRCGRAGHHPPDGHRSGRDGQEGMMAAEMVILFPVVVVLLLLVVGLGRYVHGRQLVEDASASAARAASLAFSPGEATTEARRLVNDTLEQGGVSCRQSSVIVDVSAFGPGGQVTVTVRCQADLSDLVMAGLPHTVDLSATSMVPLEKYREFAS